ncbi:MAG: TetR family transcriptional regulator [Acidimicrobiia bacterium]|nr:TetR family transcriptional regulator [Acidimicrobiia bacterium]
MTEVGRRERKKNETRAALREAALRRFADVGFAETRIVDITEAADVSERTFFRYFSSKEDAAVAALREWLERLFADVEQAPPELSPRDVVATIVENGRAGKYPFGPEEMRDVAAYITFPEVQDHVARIIDGLRVRMIEDAAARAGAEATDPYPRVLGSVITAGCFALFESMLLTGRVGASWDTAAEVLDEVLAEFAGITERR